MFKCFIIWYDLPKWNRRRVRPFSLDENRNDSFNLVIEIAIGRGSRIWTYKFIIFIIIIILIVFFLGDFVSQSIREWHSMRTYQKFISPFNGCWTKYSGIFYRNVCCIHFRAQDIFFFHSCISCILGPGFQSLIRYFKIQSRLWN